MQTKRARYRIDASPLFALGTKKRLARLLGINVKFLKSLTGRSDSLYREWDEPKPNGGMRHIEDPKLDLKRVQSRLAGLLMRIKAPDYLMCPVPQRSYVTNAATHIGACTTHTLDIKRYFPSTTSRRVFWFWSTQMRCSRDVAGILTLLATFRGHLPTGSPLSPIMSFYAHFDMWEDIQSLCEEKSCRLTVYIDDVTISGNSVPERLLWDVKKRIAKNGLRYHKERHYHGRPAEVTGLIVKADAIKLPHRRHMAVHELRRKLRQEMLDKERSKTVVRLKGAAGQFKHVENINAQIKLAPVTAA